MLLQLRAERHWTILQRLDASDPLRAELAAAGVAQATIAALYPFSLGDCTVGLRPLITPGSLAKLAEPLSLTPAVNALTRLRFLLRDGEVRELVANPPSEEQYAATLQPLATELAGHLLHALPSRIGRETTVRSAVVMLSHACTLMANIERCAGVKRDVREFFLQMTDIVLPDLSIAR